MLCLVLNDFRHIKKFAFFIKIILYDTWYYRCVWAGKRLSKQFNETPAMLQVQWRCHDPSRTPSEPPSNPWAVVSVHWTWCALTGTQSCTALPSWRAPVRLRGSDGTEVGWVCVGCIGFGIWVVGCWRNARPSPCGLSYPCTASLCLKIHSIIIVRMIALDWMVSLFTSPGPHEVMWNIGVVFRLKFVISQISLSSCLDELTMVPVHNLHVIRTPKTQINNIHSKPWISPPIKMTSHAPVDDIFVYFVLDSDPE